MSDKPQRMQANNSPISFHYQEHNWHAQCSQYGCQPVTEGSGHPLGVGKATYPTVPLATQEGKGEAKPASKTPCSTCGNVHNSWSDTMKHHALEMYSEELGDRGESAEQKSVESFKTVNDHKYISEVDDARVQEILSAPVEELNRRLAALQARYDQLESENCLAIVDFKSQIKTLTSRIEQANRLYEITLQNEMSWMKKHSDVEAERDRLAEEVERLQARYDQQGQDLRDMRARLQWLESNFCSKHGEINSCSSGPCSMCERDRLAAILKQCKRALQVPVELENEDLPDVCESVCQVSLGREDERKRLAESHRELLRLIKIVRYGSDNHNEPYAVVEGAIAKAETVDKGKKG